MLSTAASNALLKTLEEPPGHVVFVLATTDAQKVLPTIRSRTQHFEFRLLGSETLSALLHQVRERHRPRTSRRRRSTPPCAGAGDRPATPCRHSTRWPRAGWSTTTSRCWPSWPRPWPSAIPPGPSSPWPRPSEAGRDPQRLAADLAEYLRQGFLAIGGGRARQPGRVPTAPGWRTPPGGWGCPPLVRALEELGRAQVDMRDIPDQRVHLEVALIKLTHPEADDSTIALLERVERLERALADGGGVGAGTAGRTRRRRARSRPPRRRLGAAAPDPADARRAREPSGAPPHAHSSRRRHRTGDPRPADLAARPPPARRRRAAPISPAGRSARSRRQSGRRARARRSPRARHRAPGRRPTPDCDRTPGRPAAGSRRRPRLPSRDELVQVWGDGLLASLPNRARARFRVGRFVDVDGHARRSSPCPTRRTARTARRSASTSRRPWPRASAPPVPIRLVVDDDAADDPVRRGRPATRASPPTATPEADASSCQRDGGPEPPATVVAEATSPGPARSRRAGGRDRARRRGAHPRGASEAGLPRRPRGLDGVHRPAAGPGGRARAPPRHRPQVRPAHRLPPAEGGARGRHAPGRGHRGRQGAHHLVPALLQRGRGRPVRDLQRRPARRHDPVCGRGPPRHRGGGEDPGIPRSLPRAARCAQSDRGGRARPAPGQGAARPARRRGHHRDHPVHQSESRGRGHGHVPGQALEAARAQR